MLVNILCQYLVLHTYRCTNTPATDKTAYLKYSVVPGNTGNTLSYEASVALGLVEVKVQTCNLDSRSTTDTQDYNEYVQEYSDLFHGIGQIKDVQIKLHIDQEVTPKSQKHRSIPFHIKKGVEKELQRLLELDIIEKVEGPTPWVSPIVVVPKKDGVRICVDMREANEAISRHRHPLPKLDDIIAELNGARYFSTLDMNSGFHQFVLQEDSRYITCFSTHVGLFR